MKFFTILICCLLAGVASAQRRGTPPQEAKTYSSPSGKFELVVDPKNAYWPTLANYRMRKNGTLLWEKVLPFHLSYLGVSNEGVSGGCGLGVAGGESTLEIAIFSSRGDFVLHHSEKQSPYIVHHAPKTPHASGLIFSPETDKMTVLVSGGERSGGFHWRTYLMSSGALLATSKVEVPAQESDTYLVEITAIPGTPLSLFRWCSRADEYGNDYTLQAPDGQTVWALSLPPGKVPRNKGSLLDRIQANFIRSVGTGVFSLYQPATGIERKYQVGRTRNGWRVEGGESRNGTLFPPEAPIPNLPELATTPLTLTKEIDLQKVSPHASFSNLVVDQSGDFYALEENRATIHFYSKSGALRLVTKPDPTELASPRMSWQGLYITALGNIVARSNAFGAMVCVDSHGKRLTVAQREQDRLRIDTQQINLLNRTLTRIERWPNGLYIHNRRVATAPDGSVAIVSASYGVKKVATLAFYEANGAPLMQTELPVAETEIELVAFDGQHVFFTYRTLILEFDRDGKLLAKYTQPLEMKTPGCRFFTLVDGFPLFDGKQTVRYYKETRA